MQNQKCTFSKWTRIGERQLESFSFSSMCQTIFLRYPDGLQTLWRAVKGSTFLSNPLYRDYWHIYFHDMSSKYFISVQIPDMPLQIKITSFKKIRNTNDLSIWVSRYFNFSTSLSKYLKQNIVFCFWSKIWYIRRKDSFWKLWNIQKLNITLNDS